MKLNDLLTDIDESPDLESVFQFELTTETDEGWEFIEGTVKSGKVIAERHYENIIRTYPATYYQPAEHDTAFVDGDDFEGELEAFKVWVGERNWEYER